MKYRILLILIILFALSCDDSNNTPTPSTQALFMVEINNNAIAPAQVTFINESVNALSYLWKFGNGDSLQTTSEENITHIYNEAGIYNVSLRVESPNPDLYYNSLTFQKTITINNLPVKRLYFSDRVEGKIKYVALDHNPTPIIEEFESATLNKPYGMAMDTSNGKLYVTDYAEQVLNRFNWDGSGQEILMNTSTENFSSPIGIIIIDHKIYWGQPNGIFRADLDGSNLQEFISIPGEFPQDLAYDYIHNVLYFTNDLDPESGGIWKVNFDGTELTEIIPDVWGAAIEIDPENNRLYYYSGNEGMYLCSLNGDNKVLFDASNASKWTWGMAIDKETGKIYYPNRVELTIMRANLDGSNVETFIPASAEINPNAIAIDTYR